MPRPTICPCQGCPSHEGPCGYPMQGACPNGCATRSGFGARFAQRPRQAVYATAEHRRLRGLVIAELVAAHGWACPGYRRPAHPSRRLTLDHVVPIVAGGAPFDRANLGVLCASCNASKGLVERNKYGRHRGGVGPCPG